jgi:hypothetical protein
MNRRSALAFAGAAAVAAAAGGAAGSLTAAPPAFTLVAGAVLVVVAVRASGLRAVSVAATLGVVAGLALADVSPAGPRDVIERAPRGHAASDLFDALDALDADPSAFDGRRIAVSGVWTQASGTQEATVSRRVMSCCAADALDVGFDVVPHLVVPARSGMWVRVIGLVRARLRDGELRFEIDDADVAEVSPRRTPRS